MFNATNFSALEMRIAAQLSDEELTLWLGQPLKCSGCLLEPCQSACFPLTYAPCGAQ